MTKPREKTREELQAAIEDGKKKIRQFENREKMLRQKLSREEQMCIRDSARGGSPRRNTAARQYGGTEKAAPWPLSLIHIYLPV